MNDLELMDNYTINVLASFIEYIQDTYFWVSESYEKYMYPQAIIEVEMAILTTKKEIFQEEDIINAI
jgi:hypothetical protein